MKLFSTLIFVVLFAVSARAAALTHNVLDTYSGSAIKRTITMTVTFPTTSTIKVDMTSTAWRKVSDSSLAGASLAAANATYQLQTSAGSSVSPAMSQTAWGGGNAGNSYVSSSTGTAYSMSGKTVGNYRIQYVGGGGSGTNVHTFYEFNWNGSVLTEIGTPDRKKLSVTATFNPALGADFLDRSGAQLWGLFVDGDFSVYLDSYYLTAGSPTHTWEAEVALDAITTLHTAPINIRATIAEYGSVDRRYDGDSASYWGESAVVDESHKIDGTSTDVVHTEDPPEIPKPPVGVDRSPNVGVTPIVNTAPIATAPDTQGAVKLSTDALLTQIATGDSKIIQAIQTGTGAIVAAVNASSGGGGGGTDMSGTIAAVNGVKASVDAGNEAAQDERDAAQAFGTENMSAISADGVAARYAAEDASLAGVKSNVGSLFGTVGPSGGGSKMPTIGAGSGGEWVHNVEMFDGISLDMNPFTNVWVQEKFPFLNWVVGLLRVSLVWGAQVTLYMYVAKTIREECGKLMLIPSPGPTVAESRMNAVTSGGLINTVVGTLVSWAASNIFTTVALGTLLYTLFSTITSSVSTFGTISSLLSSITTGALYLGDSVTGMGATSGPVGRIIYIVTSYIPVGALMSIAGNYLLIEVGLVSTVPGLMWVMRTKRW